jgi:hypothetical protein
MDVALDPWAIKVLKIQPPSGILSATVRHHPSILKTIEATLADVDMMLPYLATRRPNLIRNGDFQEVDAKGILVGWKLYAWHAADRECTVETKDASAPARFLRINNLKPTGTVGIYSSRFSLAPGQEVTFLARLAADRAGVKARVALVGQRHIAQTYTVDTSWREVSYVWPKEQSAALGQGAKLRAEIHNDGGGALLVDNVRVVDSTFLNYPESVATEQAIADVLNARRDENLCRAFTALSNPRITRLLDALKHRRAGNEWLLLGPFDSAKGGLAGAYPPETDYLNGADLSAATYTGKENRTFKGIHDWTIKNAGAPDYIDLVSAIGPFDYSEAFAATNFYSEANQKANLLIGADDGVKVWLNGVAVFTKTGERAAKPGEFVVPVALRRGWNRVLVKVENIEKDFGFYFTVADESAKRIPGIRYAVKPPSP